MHARPAAQMAQASSMAQHRVAHSMSRWVIGGPIVLPVLNHVLFIVLVKIFVQHPHIWSLVSCPAAVTVD
jgi:hypothetical protein